MACEAAVSKFMKWEVMDGKEEEDVACEAAVKAERHRLCTLSGVLFSKPCSTRKMKRRRDAGWTGRDVQEEEDEMMLYSWTTGSPGR